MLKIFPISSSSEGNCTLVQSNKANILIDCGISLKALSSAVDKSVLNNLDAVFITHEHSDHINGIGPLGRKYKSLPVYMNDASYKNKISHFKDVNVKNLNIGDVINIKDLEIKPFTTKHDSKSSFGFTVINDKIKLCYITDTGYITPVIKNEALNSDILFIEADYDEQVLDDYEKYAQVLKDRIKSNFGHLSNEQALSFIEDLGGIDNFEYIIFGHLSPRTNSHDLLKNAIEAKFTNYNKDKVFIAPLKACITYDKI